MQQHLFEMEQHLHSQRSSLLSLSTQVSEFEKDLINKSGDLLAGEEPNPIPVPQPKIEQEEEKKEII
eukprot:CAMPEP_0170549600 /NCGR_PEP_ID=MMETSP0211-20121228/7745_1 /TAXON_ID=311385 /ORGANISM="Pseudokeronopsis sp., Strain OXSARD2" /LENGTH=66 /DNA_ID=CAMNT_0010855701 /DNA_START=108 /DNA_END=308 /DNA_ORIENTATION=+